MTDYDALARKLKGMKKPGEPAAKRLANYGFDPVTFYQYVKAQVEEEVDQANAELRKQKLPLIERVFMPSFQGKLSLTFGIGFLCIRSVCLTQALRGEPPGPWASSEGGPMADMQALQVTRNGPPAEVLAVRTVDRPVPGPDQVLVQVGAASLNFNDIDRCLGTLVSVPTPPPYTLGMDVCGTVVEAGPGGAGWLGRRVVAITTTAARRDRRVRPGRHRGGVRRARRVRRRRGHLLPHDLPGIAPGTVPPGPADGRRDPGGAFRRQRARVGRDPAGQGGRGPGDRRRRRPRQGRVLHGAGRGPGGRPHHRGLRGGRAGRHGRPGGRRGLRPDRGRRGGAVVAVHRPAAGTWPSALPTTTGTA